jgi:hypothetical protein
METYKTEVFLPGFIPSERNTCFSSNLQQTVAMLDLGHLGHHVQQNVKNGFRIGPRDTHVRVQPKPLCFSVKLSASETHYKAIS